MFDDGVAPPEDPGTQAPGLGEAPDADATQDTAPPADPPTTAPPADAADKAAPSPDDEDEGVSEVPVPGHPGNLDNAALIDSIVEY
ncbi:MAG: hypothetical protein AB7F42_31490, partial [Mycolicibacterium sp.]